MQRVGWWLLAALLVVLAVVAWVFVSLKGDKKAATSARADIIDAIQEPKIKVAKQRADALSAQFGAASVQAKAAQMDVDAALKALAAKHEAIGLTPEEVEQRLKGFSA